MKLSVIGCGYLGAVHAACMAELGHKVVGIDVDATRANTLATGEAPFYEPELDELLQRGISSGNLSFSTDFAEVADADVHFICVGTPQLEDGTAADLSYLNSAVDQVIAHMETDNRPEDRPVLIVGKSTVPVGTAQSLLEQVETAGAVLAWNPEFLREGFAVGDTLRPDRLVYGLSDDDAKHAYGERVLDEVYADILEAGTPKVVTDYGTSELVKVAANAFLATKISFINAMAEICDVVGADVTTLAQAIGHDDRIGKKFLRAGIGFGGGCLPKDIRAFMARADQLGTGESLTFLEAVDSLNLRQRERAVNLLEDNIGGSLDGKRIAVLGGSFKPDSDDIRDSPAVDIARRLIARGATVTLFDPKSAEIVHRAHPDIAAASSTADALTNADGVAVLTEWQEFRELDPQVAAELVTGKVVLDGRNCLDPRAWRSAGFTYIGMGRP